MLQPELVLARQAVRGRAAVRRRYTVKVKTPVDSPLIPIFAIVRAT